MKKLVLVALAASFCGAAQAKMFAFGVKAGINVPSLSASKDFKKPELKLGYHAGLFGEVNLPIVGIGVQPEVLLLFQDIPYVDNTGSKTKNGYMLEVPVNLTWGIDLKLVRPFAALTPYLRYSLTDAKTLVSKGNTFEPSDIKNLSYGLGLGLGVEALGKLQLMGRYSWGLNELVSGSSGYKVNGWTVSLGYIF